MAARISGNASLLGDVTTKLSIKLTDSTFQRHRGDPAQFVTELVRSANPQFLEGVEVLAEPAITNIPAAQVDALVARATELDPTYVPVNFNSWFSVVLVGKTEDGKRKVSPVDGGPSREVEVELLARLRDMPGEIESAQAIVPASPPAAVFPDDDPDSFRQGYLNTAPQGIDARYAWTKNGGDGVNGSIVDVEWDWLLEHPDLVAHPPS